MEAGVELQVALRTYGRVLEALNETHRDAACAWVLEGEFAECTASQLPRAREIWTRIAGGLDTLVAHVRKIPFPDEVADDVAEILEALTAERDAAHAAVDSRSLDAFNRRADAAVGTRRTSNDLTQAFLDDLGVPPPEAP